MTRDEVIDLLSVVVAYEPRRAVGDADIRAWLTAANRGGWTADEALDAVCDYELRAEYPIRPADVHRLLRAGRQGQLEKAYVPGQCADPELWARMEAFANSKAVDRVPDPALPPAQADRRGRSPGRDVVAEAMARGASARAAHEASAS